MSRSVRSSLLAGGLLAVLAFVLVDHGGHLGTQLTKVALLGAVLGVALGYVPDRSPAWRAGAFACGFLAAWGGYALRAGVLPDIPLGRAIAAAAVIAVVTVAVLFSAGRMPLWAGLLGIAAMVGAYEFTYTATPTSFKPESAAAATAVFLSAAIGFVIGILVGETSSAGAEEEQPAPSATVTLPTQKEPASAADSGISIVTPTEAESR